MEQSTLNTLKEKLKGTASFDDINKDQPFNTEEFIKLAKRIQPKIPVDAITTLPKSN